ncbi:hypothetical protein [Streptomyces sp. SCL15-4]|uniref:hypothetical protein n=1 Tax=Streptomyces sp. SCL15-4 TaxID=2967221 RepID=UPI002966B4EB|nr:hypothetical protein [Streptomyces sp. SCL15-4]
MRRTARAALSVAFAAGAVLALTGPAATAAPVPLPASCDPLTGPVPVPGALGAAPMVPGDKSAADPGCEDTSPGAGGREPAVPDGGGVPDAGAVGGPGKEAAGPDGTGWDGSAREGTGQVGGPDGPGWDGSGQTGGGQDTGGREEAGQADGGPGGGGRDGGSPDGGGQDGRRCGQSRDADCSDDGHACREGRDTDTCRPAGVQHGVDAGAGGAFGASVPALAAGAVLIAAACAGAGYRVYGRTRLAADQSAEM